LAKLLIPKLASNPAIKFLEDFSFNQTFFEYLSTVLTLIKRIKNDKRIEFFENCDIRNFKSKICFDILTCDVSFISILNIIDSINSLNFKKIIILFKPQFEVGINVKRDKKGVVKDKLAIEKARENFIAKTLELKWKLEINSLSKLQGKDGNDEELFYFSK